MKMRSVLFFLLTLVAGVMIDEVHAAPQRRAWLGVSVQDLTPKLARTMGLKITEGALVTDVVEKSPADSAGIQEKDVIVEFAGRMIYDASDLVKAVERQEPGTRVELTIVRKNERKKLSATLGKRPRRMDERMFGFSVRPPRIQIFRSGEILGMELMELNDQLAEYFQVPEGDGVLIKRVEKNSEADKAGLKAGDVILSVGGKRVNDIDDVNRALRRYEEGDKVEIEVLRKGTKKTVTVVIENEEDLSGVYYFEHGPSEELLERIESQIRPRLDDLQFELRQFRIPRPRIEIGDLDPPVPPTNPPVVMTSRVL